MSDKLIKCNHNHQDCFGRLSCGLCVVLSEPITDKDCPFYKNKTEYFKGIQETNERINNIIERM